MLRSFIIICDAVSVDFLQFATKEETNLCLVRDRLETRLGNGKLGRAADDERMHLSTGSCEINLASRQRQPLHAATEMLTVRLAVSGVPEACAASRAAPWKSARSYAKSKRKIRRLLPFSCVRNAYDYDDRGNCQGGKSNLLWRERAEFLSTFVKSANDLDRTRQKNSTFVVSNGTYLLSIIDKRNNCVAGSQRWKLGENLIGSWFRICTI